MEPVSISINDTARAIGLGRTKIYALIQEGKLRSVKIGGRTLVLTSSIRELIDALSKAA